MIKSLQGKILDINENELLIEVNNMGYSVFFPKNSISHFKINDIVFTYIYMAISENNIVLYGFTSKILKNMFELLLSVNGVGPKVALSLVGSLSTNEIVYAILQDDWKILTKAVGVGTKAAQKIAIDLKVKIEKNIDKYIDKDINDIGQEFENKIKTEDELKLIKTGLKSLGFSPALIDPVLSKIDIKNKTTEELLTEALKLIGSKKK